MKDYRKKPVQSWKDKFDLGEHWFRKPTKKEISRYFYVLALVLSFAAFTDFAGPPWF